MKWRVVSIGALAIPLTSIDSIASGKEFSVDSYHYFGIKDGKIIQSGDYFDATGMVMATQPDPVEEEVVE